MNALDFVSGLLIALAGFDVVFTVILVRAAHRTGERSLTERAVVSVMLTAFAVGVALLAINRLASLHLPTEFATLILIGGLFLISVPQFMWVIAYARKGFR